ncbi:uncharacterized protein LOC114519643 [Dendronephthya gigantea]|uniref:uncharacterized protein LOC114519643 n=1 Tax=Dendronephthya gigantea TaxID=151771 RepID=UPI00106BC7E7|nr:uncharacterized protein LOC114519643 [Dendronephthya gigantea]
MASRWRTWDLNCLEETLGGRPREEDVEPLILAGSLKEIPYIDLSSIILPKEALSCDDGSLRSRGRGRSLANRALALDKPSRRPGERGSSDKAQFNAGRARSLGSPISSLGSKFLGSEELYEDLFPSLGESTDNAETNSSCSSRVSKWGNKPEKARQSSQELRNDAERTTSIERPFFEEPEEKFKSIETGDFDKSRYDKNSANTADISNNVYKPETSRSFSMISKHSTSVQEILPNNDTKVPDTPLSLNSQKSDCQIFNAIMPAPGGKDVTLCDDQQPNDSDVNTDDQPLDKFKGEDVINLDGKIESKNHLFPQSSNANVEVLGQLICDKLKPDNNLIMEKCWNDNQPFQENNDDNEICEQLFTRPDEKTVCYEETKEVGISQLDESKNTEKNADAGFNKQHSTDLSPVGNDEIIILSDAKDEVEKHQEQNDLNNDNSVASLDMSTNELEMDPCNILLENLPLAITEEELEEIVEPYGEMVSYKFKDDEKSKMCNIRMPCSSSGELLVVSLDGLEINGYRIKATMKTEA